MAVHEVKHPLMREAELSTKLFRELASEVGMLLTYEATRNLPAEKVWIESWAGPVEVERIKGKKFTIVPILRAGLGMMEGVLRAVPTSKNWCRTLTSARPWSSTPCWPPAAP